MKSKLDYLVSSATLRLFFRILYQEKKYIKLTFDLAEVRIERMIIVLSDLDIFPKRIDVEGRCAVVLESYLFYYPEVESYY